MKTSTLEWVEKAEGDWDEALRAYRARKRPNYDASCFHAQQCLEKYLKARLCEAGLQIQKNTRPFVFVKQCESCRTGLNSDAASA